MKTNKLMLLALGGLLAIGTATYAEDEKKPEGKPPGERPAGGPGGGQRMSPEERFAKLCTDLALTEDQKPKVKAIVDDTRTQMQGLKDLAKEDASAKRKEIGDAQKAKMKEVLTAEQFAKFEKLPGFGGGRRGPGGPGGEGKAPKGEKPEGKKE